MYLSIVRRVKLKHKENGVAGSGSLMSQPRHGSALGKMGSAKSGVSKTAWWSGGVYDFMGGGMKS